MSTLYRPVVIESAEQARALPEWTALLGTSDLWPVELNDEGLWCNDGITLSHEDVVGRTALVPIEADEEVLTEETYASSEQLRRFTTPWQRFTTPKETP